MRPGGRFLKEGVCQDHLAGFCAKWELQGTKRDRGMKCKMSAGASGKPSGFVSVRLLTCVARYGAA